MLMASKILFKICSAKDDSTTWVIPGSAYRDIEYIKNQWGFMVFNDLFYGALQLEPNIRFIFQCD